MAVPARFLPPETLPPRDRPSLINTLVTAPEGPYTQMERWRLSSDGKTLTIGRQIVRLHGERESTLVDEKE